VVLANDKRPATNDGFLYFYPIEPHRLAHGFNNERAKIDIKRVKLAVGRAKVLMRLGFVPGTGAADRALPVEQNSGSTRPGGSLLMECGSLPVAEKMGVNETPQLWFQDLTTDSGVSKPSPKRTLSYTEEKHRDDRDEGRA
jgi:hypothetical protein